MFKTILAILGLIVISVIMLFLMCCFIVSSWADEMEEKENSDARE